MTEKVKYTCDCGQEYVIKFLRSGDRIAIISDERTYGSAGPANKKYHRDHFLPNSGFAGRSRGHNVAVIKHARRERKNAV